MVLVVKNTPANAGDIRNVCLISRLGRSPEERKAGYPLQYSCLPGEFHGQRNLVGYSPWGCKELDKTELN